MTSTWPDTNSGEILGGRYRLHETVGAGGMATVHRAHDLVLDRDVAVKVFRTDVSEANDPRRVQAEMKILGSVNHPNLVTLHDASLSEDGQTAFLVMELIDGEDLGQLLSEGRISRRDAVTIGAQIAGALAHIHRKGIVHRDVKPANILVRRDQDGRVWAKLADLGIARIADATRLTTAGSVLGTVAYLSPEQVSGAGVDSTSDVYALGLVLIEALSGRKPFPGTPQESAAMRTVRPPQLPEGVDVVNSSLLRAMTSLDPATRISAAHAEEALTRWAAGGPGTVTMPTGTFPGEFSDLTQPMSAPFPPQLPTDGTARIPTGGFPAADPTAPLAPGSWTGPQDATARLATGGLPAPAGYPTGGMPTGGVPATGALQAPGYPSTAEQYAVAGPLTTGSTRIARRRSRRGLLIFLIVLAVLLLAAVLAAPFVIDALTAAKPGDVPYPQVTGDLGDLLKDLQKSVDE